MTTNATGWDFGAGFMLIQGADIKLQSSKILVKSKSKILSKSSVGAEEHHTPLV